MLAESVALAPWLVLLATSASASIVVEGGATCPTAAEVTAQLPATLFERVASPRDRIRIENDQQNVHITLQGQEGGAVVDRVLPQTGSCAELARAAAVLLEVWLVERHPEWTEPVALPPPVIATSSAPAPPESPTSPSSYEIALSAGLDATAISAAPALAWEGFRWGQRWGVGLGVLASAPTTLDLGAGQSRWMHATLWSGVARRWDWYRWRLTLDGGLGAGMVFAWGSGFTHNYAKTGLAPVATMAVVLGRLLARSFTLAIEVRATAWPWPPTLAADNAESPSRRLPTWHTFSALRLSW